MAIRKLCIVLNPCFVSVVIVKFRLLPVNIIAAHTPPGDAVGYFARRTTNSASSVREALAAESGTVPSCATALLR